MLKSDGTTQNYLYLHRDYQGTIVAISDQTGAVVEKRLFDAWGNIVKVQDGAGNILNGLTILDRGYTGHEHLQSVGLIHMNGRLYDPKLHRFLQLDNFIQQPENTQNYNKYGYCLNNPLKYTDPSGELFGLGEFATAVIIGAVIAAASYTLTTALADVPFTLGGLAKATFIGAASAAVTFGIGSAANSLFSASQFVAKATFQAVAHGTFQGAMTAVSGGKFWSGFAAGALSSIASSAWSGGDTGQWQGIGGKFADSGAGMIAFGTVSGGAGAALTGGNFWQGAVTGLVVSGLNHYGHMQEVKSEIEKNFPGLIKAMSKIRTYLSNNEEVMKSFTENSGYSRSQALKIFTLSNLIKTVKVTILSNYGEFNPNDSKNVYIDKYLATSIDKGGYLQSNGNRTSFIGTEFLAGVTIMHEFVHQGRFINGLSKLIGPYEAGQYFETVAFGQVNYSSTVDSYVKRSGW